MAKANKLLVAWSHFPIVFGLLVPIVTWFMYKDSDKKAAFQAKQALVWQVLWGVIFGIVGVGGSVLVAALVWGGGGGGEVIGLLFLLVLLVLFAVCLLFAVLGAIKMLQDKDFLYPVIGKMLK